MLIDSVINLVDNYLAYSLKSVLWWRITLWEVQNNAGADWGVQNSAGQRWKAKLSCQFWIPQYAPRRILDPSNGAPQSFGEMQHVPRFLWRHSYRVLNIRQNKQKNWICPIFFVNHCYFRDLSNQYDFFLIKNISWNCTFKVKALEYPLLHINWA